MRADRWYVVPDRGGVCVMMLGSPCSPCCSQCRPLQLPQRIEIDVQAVESVVQSQRFGSVNRYDRIAAASGLDGWTNGIASTITYYQPQFLSGTYSLSAGQIISAGTTAFFQGSGGVFSRHFFANDFFLCEITSIPNRGIYVAVIATYMYLLVEQFVNGVAFGTFPAPPTLEQFKQRFAAQSYLLLNGTLYPLDHDWGLGFRQYPAGLILGGRGSGNGAGRFAGTTSSRTDTTILCNTATSISSVTSVVSDDFASLPLPASVLPINGGSADFTGVTPPFNEPRSLLIAAAYLGPEGPPPTYTISYPEVRSALRKSVTITGVRGYANNNALVPLF